MDSSFPNFNSALAVPRGEVARLLEELSLGSTVVVRLTGTTRGDITFDPIPVRELQDALARLECYSGPSLQRAPEPPHAELLPHHTQAFEAADAEINRVYQQARSLLPEESFVELRDMQRAWIEYRDQRATDATLFSLGWPDEVPQVENLPAFWQARALITEERTSYLQGWVRAFDGSYSELGPWTGVWVDSFGGHLHVAQLDDETLLFRLQVVRGPTGHLGDVGGAATIEGTTARFTTSLAVIEDEVEILMTRLGPHIEVSTSGPVHHFHGARAYFHGSYARSGPLSPLAHRELLTSEVTTR